MSSPDWNNRSAIDTNGFGYLTFDGGSDGSIQATAQGSGLADQGVASQGIYALNCTGCTFEHLTIKNLYRHTSASDTSVDQTLDNAIVFSGSHITIAGNTIHDVGWALFARWRDGDAHNLITGNNIYNFDHGFIATASGSVSDMRFSHNHLHDMANWDARSSSGGVPYHHDGLHCFGPVGGPAPTYNGFYVFDNRFDGTVGREAPTGQIFMEGGSGAGATPCASSSSRVYLFNNVVTSSDYVTANSYLGTASINGGVYNNTVLGVNRNVNEGGCAGYGYEQPGSTIAFENNIVSGCNILMTQTGQPNGVFAPGSPDYNVYANGGNNAFVCNGNFYAFGQFRTWKTCMRADSHSLRIANAGLDNRGDHRRGSAATRAGTNLTPLCRGPLTALCRNIMGKPRPTSGPWSAGAY
jgi:hypothetical protein